MRPIRVQDDGAVTQNPWTGETTPDRHVHTAHALGHRGLLESMRLERRFACGCGCISQAAGFCSVCGATACPSCLARCGACLRPLCPAHQVVIACGSPFRLCRDCNDASVRRRLLRGAARWALSPFVRFESR